MNYDNFISEFDNTVEIFFKRIVKFSYNFLDGIENDTNISIDKSFNLYFVYAKDKMKFHSINEFYDKNLTSISVRNIHSGEDFTFVLPNDNQKFVIEDNNTILSVISYLGNKKLSEQRIHVNRFFDTSPLKIKIKRSNYYILESLLIY